MYFKKKKVSNIDLYVLRTLLVALGYNVEQGLGLLKLNLHFKLRQDKISFSRRL